MCLLSDTFEKQFRVSVEPAKEHNQSALEILRYLSHETRTPINIVEGNLTFLDEDMKGMSYDSNWKLHKERINEANNAFATLTSVMNDIILHEKCKKQPLGPQMTMIAFPVSVIIERLSSLFTVDCLGYEKNVKLFVGKSMNF